MWVNCKRFLGTGRIFSLGGNGNGGGGGGAGGRITVNYQSGNFHSDRTFAYGGLSASEFGGPGVVFLNGITPLNTNLRIDNKGRQAKVK